MLLNAASARKPRHRSKRSSLFSALAVTVVLLLTGTSAIGSMVGAPAAYAADGALEITKTVDAAGVLNAGDEFTYEIKVACQDAHCINASMSDPLPDAFEGFGIVGAPIVTPASLDTSVAFGCSGAVTNGCELVVTALSSLPDGDTGLYAGAGFTVMFTL